MEQQTRNCQNCKTDFIIEPDDFDFYKKIDVPPPTFCPDCRLQRRYAWRNERMLFKTSCSNCKKSIFSSFPPELEYNIYCRECWFSDKWDPMSYGQEYDFSKPFFVQWVELLKKTPLLNLYQLNSLNSPYANIIGDSKDCYLAYSITKSEEAYYSKNIDRSRQIFDSLNVMDSEYCYENVYGSQNFEVKNSVFTRGCLNSAFLFDCVNSRNCFMSSNLRNREYVFYGQQLNKEEYEKKIAEINSGPATRTRELLKDFQKMSEAALHRYANIVKCSDSSGDVLSNNRNVKDSFEVYDSENIRYAARTYDLKDSMDVNNTIHSELLYEYTNGGRDSMDLKFSLGSMGAERNCTYTGWCGSSSDLFGCVGIRNKQYCILNKQYTKEEYETLLPKVIEHMNAVPYKGAQDRGYRYGEFYPVELSPFPYNGSVAHEHFPLTKEEIERRGYNYREPETKHPSIDINSNEIISDITTVTDDILKKTLGCEDEGRCMHQCTIGFKITPQELALYRRLKISLPHRCPNCRHYDRLEWRNPWHLWHRQCMKEGCANEFQTSYAPNRPEIVYCEACYQQEVV